MQASFHRMKVAFCMINCNRRDGSARAVNEVAERLSDRHEIHLYARQAEDLDLGKVTWHRVAGPGWPEVADFASYHQIVGWMLAGHRFDIVHSIGCNAPDADVITIQNIQPAKRKILRRLDRGGPLSPARKFTRMLYLRVTTVAERRLYTHHANRRTPLFLPVSRGVEAELRAHYDIGPASVQIIPNAADTTVFHPISEPERITWRQANGVPADAPLLIFSGGEWARKGLDDALRGLARLMRPDVYLFVAGDDADRESYRSLARELGVAAQVVFGGFRRDVALAMAASDIFLFPSWYEAFSLATIEAAACGLPIIATRINGTEDFIQPGVTGEFIERDAEQMAVVLRRMVDDPQLRREMGANARRLVEERYTWDRVSELTEAAYQQHLACRGISRPGQNQTQPYAP